MACLHPIPAVQDEIGHVTLYDTLSEAFAEGGMNGYLELNCGRCEACRRLRVRDWAIRSYHESLMWTRPFHGVEIPNGCFVTLTYNDENLPEDGSLHVEHWQKFIRSLRKKRGVGSVRFIHCGEYGPTNGRPHYHGLLFNESFHLDRSVLRREGSEVIWRSEELEGIWEKGYCTLGPISYATAAYTAGYVVKKMKRAAWSQSHDVYDGDGRVIETKKEEYITMSRRPGLGRSWIEKFWRDVYPKDEVWIEGKKFRPPKYYDTWLEEKAVLEPEPFARVLDQVVESRREHNARKGPSTQKTLEDRRANYAARDRLYGKARQDL